MNFLTGQQSIQYDQDRLTKNNQIIQNITWCTISTAEQQKCENFSIAVKRNKTLFEENYFDLYCKQAFNKEECMRMIESENAQMTTLDAGEVFVAGRYYSLVPIMQELDVNRMKYQYAIAVIKKGSLPDVQTLYDLKGKKACFPGVETLAGWALPINIVSKRKTDFNK